MSQLHLSLLGEPIVKHGEDNLTFSTRKALALLIYLAVEGGMHTRKTLSESFWPELDAERGRAALRATLFELRKLLERSHRPSEQTHLLAERDTLGLAQDSSLLLDLCLVESVSKHVGRRGEPLADQVGGELLAQLEHATRLVRGPFLAGFTLRDSQFFDDWTRQHREYWRLCVYQLLDALSRFYERAGEIERALETVSRWLGFDPLHEEGYRRLMRLRFAAGDRVGALRAYTACREVLTAELALEPEAETVALAKWIRQTAPVRRAPSPSPSPSSSTGEPPTQLSRGPFVGRAAEFGSLMECYQRVQSGQAHVVLLRGATGVGKTRLATEFLAWAQAQGAEVLMGKALHTGRQLPYQTLIATLRHHLEQEHAPSELVSDVWLAELARLLPELRDRSPDLPDPAMDKVLWHSRLCEATARLLQGWATHHPLVLLLDEMQWADTATRDLVLYLAQSLADRPAPILLLLNLCIGIETFPDPPSTWLIALKRTGIPLTTLELASFTREETLHFVQALAWVEPQPEAERNRASDRCQESEGSSPCGEPLASFAHWLYVQTGGQPSYMVELLKGLLEQEMMVPSLQRNGSWELVLRSELLEQTPASALIPAGVRELIHCQLEQLPPAARSLVVAGAVMGEGLTFERLCQVAQLDEETGVQALEELLRRGWLCEGTRAEASQVEGGYIFRGEMIRVVVYQEAGAVRQRLVQRRAAAVLQAEAEYDQGEEALLPSPTPLDRHAVRETRERPQRPVVAGAASRQMSGMRLVDHSAVGEETGTIRSLHAPEPKASRDQAALAHGFQESPNWPLQMSRRRADTSIDKKTPLGVWGRGAAVHAPFARPRSPPGSPARAFLRRTEAERVSARLVRKEKRREIRMTNQEQLDLLKQESATLWNTWREKHPNTAIELSRVDLSEANLGEVNLAEADLSQANLREADLNNANLSKARLAGADLSGANLAGADLSAADLREATLHHAYLTNANLAGANLRGAILFDAHLNWAMLEGALITPQQLSQANMEPDPL